MFSFFPRTYVGITAPLTDRQTGTRTLIHPNRPGPLRPFAAPASPQNEKPRRIHSPPVLQSPPGVQLSPGELYGPAPLGTYHDYQHASYSSPIRHSAHIGKITKIGMRCAVPASFFPCCILNFCRHASPATTSATAIVWRATGLECVSVEVACS